MVKSQNSKSPKFPRLIVTSRVHSSTMAMARRKCQGSLLRYGWILVICIQAFLVFWMNQSPGTPQQQMTWLLANTAPCDSGDGNVLRRKETDVAPMKSQKSTIREISGNIGESEAPPLLEVLRTQSELDCSHNPELTLVSDFVPGNLQHLLERRANQNIKDDINTLPAFVHVTAKSRCILPKFDELLQRWRQASDEPWAVLLHNDAAVHALLRAPTTREAFPSLLSTLACVTSGAELADLWRALVLWNYGGIYTDMDNAPTNDLQEPLRNLQHRKQPSNDGNATNSTSINFDNHCLFVMEAQGMPSQYFFACTPRHPILYLLLQVCLHRLQALHQVAGHYAPYITGPGALKQAWRLFLRQQGTNEQLFGGSKKAHKNNPNTTTASSLKFSAGIYVGLQNATVQIIGKAKQPNQYVERNVVYQKRNLYRQMNMTHFSRVKDDTSDPSSCWERMHEQEWMSQKAPVR